jgi:hypothetical protein
MKTTRFVVAGLVTALGAALIHDAARACEVTKELAERRAKIAAMRDATDAERAREHYLLGVWAKEKGLDAEARTAFTQAVELESDHAGARQELGHVQSGERWLTLPEAMEAKGMVLRDGRWILQEEADILDLPAKQRELRREGQAKVRKLLDTYAAGGDRAKKIARESLDTIEDEHKVEPMAFALRSRDEDVRTLAAEELGKIGNRRALRPLLHRSVFDPSEDVRFASIDAAKAIGDANLIKPLVGALASESANVRMNAAHAIARAGDVRGVKYLVYRFEARGGGGPRAYNMNVNQLTFIQDFDVEVAQTAFIADPIPGVIQEGTVLDVQVVATQQTSYIVEREVIHGSLQRLTGARDVPMEDGAWAKWYRENEDELTASR